MIINSILDTDLYKFTMQQAVLHQFPEVEVEYKFICRTKGIDFKPFINKITKEIRNLKTLKLTQEEESYLHSIKFLKPDYIKFLKLFRFDLNYVFIYMENGDLNIDIKGPWVHTILFEVPVLAIVSEIYSVPKETIEINKFKILEQKINFINNYSKSSYFKFADFGTRRRFSFTWHDQIIQNLKVKTPESFIGTSNVYFAKKYNVKPIGTMAHEWVQAHQQLNYRLVDSQKMAFENWIKEYRGNLGIALTDTIGFFEFLDDFDLYFCKLFDGVRQDSGDPFFFGYEMIEFYENMGIDPKTKTIVFSNNLTFQEISKLHIIFHRLINVSFGIGTNLTNDVNFKPLQIVLKMIKCNKCPVAKITDTPDKEICIDKDFFKYLKKVFKKR